MLMVIRIVGLVLVLMGFFTMYFAHKHGRLEGWTVAGGSCYILAGLIGVWYVSWWPILGGVLLGAGISRFGGLAADRR
jgi:hypothetical protein